MKILRAPVVLWRMKTLITKSFDPSRPLAVVRRGWAEESIPDEIIAQADCLRCAQEDLARYGRSMLGLEIVQLRPVPAKGSAGGWRVAPAAAGLCRRAPMLSVDDWPLG